MAKIEILFDDKGTPKLVKGNVELLGKALNDLGVGYDKTTAKAKASHAAHSQLANGLKALFVGLTVHKLIEMADAYDEINDKLGLVTKSTEQAEKAMEALLQVSISTGTKITDNAGTYQAVGLALQRMGKSAEGAGDLLGTIVQANRSAGTSAEKAQAGFEALNKGLIKGSVTQKQWLSIMSSTPGVAAAIAVGLGTTTQRLTEMAQAGQLSSEKIAQGLTKVKSTFDTLRAGDNVTVKEGFNALTSALTVFIGKGDEAGGISDKLGRAMQFLAQHISTVVTVLVVLAGLWVTVQVIQFGLSIVALTNQFLAFIGVAGGLTTVLRTLSVAMLTFVATNPILAAIAAISLAIVGLITYFGGWGAIMDYVNGVAKKLGFDGIGSLLQWLGQMAFTLSGVGIAWQALVAVWNAVVGAAQTVGDALTAIGLGTFVEWVKSIAAWVMKIIVEFYEWAKAILGVKSAISSQSEENKKAMADQLAAIEKSKKEMQSATESNDQLGNSYKSLDTKLKENQKYFQSNTGAAHSMGTAMADANGNALNLNSGVSTLAGGMQGVATTASSATGAISGMASAFGNAAGAAYNMNAALAASTAGMNGGGLDRGGFGPSTSGGGNGTVRVSEYDGYGYDRFGNVSFVPGTEESNRKVSQYAQNHGYQTNKSGQVISWANNAAPKALGSFAMGEQVVVQGQAVMVAPGGGEIYSRLLAMYQAQGNGNPEMAALVGTRAARHSIAAGNGFAQFVADERGLANVGLLQALKDFESGASSQRGFGNYNPAFAQNRPFSLSSSNAYRGGFAYGGSFMVGGSGGTDSQLVAFHASPDEMVTVSKPGQGGGSGRPVNITMNIQARDADSFNRSKTQVLSDMGRAISQAARSL